MKLLGLVFDNFGLKVLALLMAWALWFMARANLTEKVLLDMPVQVVVEEGADAWRVRSKVERVTIEVEGPARVVAGLATERQFRAVVTFPAQRPETPEHTTQFTFADVSIPELKQFDGARALRMEPESFRVEGQRLVEDVITVPRPEVPTEIGLATVRVLEWDNSVVVRGAQTDLKSLGGWGLRTRVSDEVLLELATGLGALGRLVTQVRLDVDAEQRRQYYFEMTEPRELQVRLELRSIDYREVTLPLQIHYVAAPGGGPRRRIRFSPGNEIGLREVYTPGESGAPPTLRITLEGTPGAIAELDESRLRAFVVEDEIPEGQDVYNLPVKVMGLPFGVRLQGRIAVAVEVE